MVERRVLYDLRDGSAHILDISLASHLLLDLTAHLTQSSLQTVLHRLVLLPNEVVEDTEGRLDDRLDIEPLSLRGEQLLYLVSIAGPLGFLRGQMRTQHQSLFVEV